MAVSRRNLRRRRIRAAARRDAHRPRVANALVASDTKVLEREAELVALGASFHECVMGRKQATGGCDMCWRLVRRHAMERAVPGHLRDAIMALPDRPHGDASEWASDNAPLIEAVGREIKSAAHKVGPKRVDRAFQMLIAASIQRVRLMLNRCYSQALLSTAMPSIAMRCIALQCAAPQCSALPRQPLMGNRGRLALDQVRAQAS